VVRPIVLVVLTACVAAPRYTPCGDGRVDPGEQCDDGNTVSGDGCSTFCQLENYQDAAVPTMIDAGVVVDASLPDAALPDASPPDAAAPDAVPRSPVGAPCTSDAECAGGLCLTDQLTVPFPGGACSQPCTAAACPSGSTCATLGAIDACLPTCNSPNDCRAGYACVRVAAGTKACLPR
jgi:cysteine-rich repeat protein